MIKALRTLSCGILIPFASLVAQSAWSPVATGNALDVRISRGFYSEGGPDFATFAMTPSLRIAVTPTLMIEAELPFARASQSSPFGGESVSGLRIGNPYGGVAAELAPGVRLRAGIRIGLIPDDLEAGDYLALGYGVVSEYDRFESFLPDYTTVRATVELGAIPARGGFVQARIGGTQFMASEGGENETLAEYGVRAGLHTGSLLFHGGVLGRAVITAIEGATLADRTSHMVAFGVAVSAGRFRPHAEFRLFLDEELRQEVQGILALGMALAI